MQSIFFWAKNNDTCQIMGLLGLVALRTGKKLEWDPVQGKATNAPEADQYIKEFYRPGWEPA